MADVHYSFVILTFNSAKYIETCLSSINDTVSKLEKTSEIYVIDNGSTDGTNEIVSLMSFCQEFRLFHIRLGKNTGTTFSRNIGLRSCSGKFIVVLDSDAYINPEALEQLQSYLEENLNCGIAVPKVTFPDGRYQLSTDSFPTITRKLYRYFYLREIEKQEPSSDVLEVDYAISAFWMFRRGLLEKVGLLDEKIFYSPEDVDFCIRVWKQGYTVTYVPVVSVIHDAQEISRSNGVLNLFNKFFLSHIKGLIYLYTKHSFIFSTRNIKK